MSSTRNGSPQGDGSHELETGPYLLRPLLSDIALNESGDQDDTYITCVEHWNDNIYVGTSKGEILHFVSIPPAGDEPQPQKTFIQAFRFHPISNGANNAPNAVPGVQQILLLPTALKACILCNGTLTMYSLPELSPAFGSSIKVSNCTWVGGVNQNASLTRMEADGGVEVLVCLKSRMRIVKLGETVQRMRDIEIGGCITAMRRDNVACVADGKSYSLLELVEKQMMPLFDISSVNQAFNGVDKTDTESSTPSEQTSQVPVTEPEGRNSIESVQNKETTPNEAGDVAVKDDTEQPDVGSSDVAQHPKRSSSIPDPGSTHTSTGTEPQPNVLSNQESLSANSKQSSTMSPLIPHVLSPSAEEFLLTTGTSFNEPGVGMFVNMDGDVVPRATIEFTRYPQSVVLDGQTIEHPDFESQGSPTGEGYVLALVKGTDKAKFGSIEIQRWDVEPAEAGTKRQTIDLDRYLESSNKTPGAADSNSGMRTTISPTDIALAEVVEVLAMKPVPLELFSNLAMPPKMDKSRSLVTRQREEQNFIARLSKTQSQLVVWARDLVWNAVRNPLILRLEAQLQLSTQQQEIAGYAALDRQKVEFVINDIRGQEPNDELEFFALTFVRQKASLLLFLNLVHRTLAGQNIFERDLQITEEVLLAGEIDPRTVLAAVPSLREEIVVSADGLWLQGGLVDVLSDFINHQNLPPTLDINTAFSSSILPMVKRFLFSWRKKKGFGSITDEEAVFKSVDAAAVRLLVLLDNISQKGPAVKGSVRSELYSVVDRGVDAFDRAVTLLETHKRLYVLSRLYQSRKMSAQVLGTWKRLLEGEEDVTGEFLDGENEVRKYLRHLKDSGLVQNYGCWLARRNPKLGVQVFADENNRVKFQPKEAVDILKREAPAAVKEYLEYLVFSRKLSQYADDLVGYYFDSVINELETSSSAKETIMKTYEAYRALSLPKPTYAQFIADQPIEGDWWQNRIRLLQLLGGSHGATTQYDVHHVMSRIAPYEKELVPELVIAYGRQGRHSEAIRLLTHGLGDFDTAVSYCVMGGGSTYSAVAGPAQKKSKSSRKKQEDLFKDLLNEFLRVENTGMRMTQTSELLERFANWFDIDHVLSVIPDDWPVDALLGFLENRFRHLIDERNQTAIQRALISVQNLGLSSRLIEKIDSLGPIVQELQQNPIGSA